MGKLAIRKFRQMFHPNRITASSVALTVGGLALLQSGYTDILGLGLIGAGYTLDLVDGKLARKWRMQTSEGARLDPLVDKIKMVLSEHISLDLKFWLGIIFYL
jgi:phosphatidylglycerophosphate synthase